MFVEDFVRDVIYCIKELEHIHNHSAFAFARYDKEKAGVSINTSC
jgi:GTP cyclohydrolase FolE2